MTERQEGWHASAHDDRGAFPHPESRRGGARGRLLYEHPDFLDGAMCERIRRAMDLGEADPAEILDTTLARRDEARRAASIEIDAATLGEVERRLDALRADLARFFGVSLVGREGAGFLRYGDGGGYGLHRDRADVAAWPDAARRCISLVTFLNASRAGSRTGAFDGGLLRLVTAERVVDVVPREGLLVAFPAELLHEVTLVRGGIRDAIVDWMYEKRIDD